MPSLKYPLYCHNDLCEVTEVTKSFSHRINVHVTKVSCLFFFYCLFNETMKFTSYLYVCGEILYSVLEEGNFLNCT